MSWLTSWIKKRSGENQKVNVKDQQGRFDAGMLETKDRYSDIYDMGKEQTEWGSDYNTNIKASFDEDAADNAAEVARLNQRTLAASGGAPAAVSTAQSADVMNQAYAGSASNYGSFFNDSRNSGLETMGGAASTMANIDNNRFNMGESARTNNAAIDSNAAKYKMGLLTGGLGVAGNLMMGNPMGAMGSAQTMFSQKGGLIGQAFEGYQDGDFVGNGTSDYRARLEAIPQQFQDKQSSGYYTDEGDYSRQGLLSRYGFSQDAQIDTAYGGQSPNSQVGMRISEGDRRTQVDLGRGNRMESDRMLDESRLKSQWSAEDREQGRGYEFGVGYHPDSYAKYSSDKMKSEDDDFFGPDGFQTGDMVGGPRPGEMRARHEQMMREQTAQQRDPQNNVPMEPSENEYYSSYDGDDVYNDAESAQYESWGVEPQEQERENVHSRQYEEDRHRQGPPIPVGNGGDEKSLLMQAYEMSGPSVGGFKRIGDAGRGLWDKYGKQEGGFINSIPTRLGGQIIE